MSFQNAMVAVLKREGGYVNDPTDRGGETNFGVTLTTARRAGYQGSMKNMTVEEATAIYKKNYWDPLKLDEVAGMDEALADRLFDISVNQGTRAAGQFLQRALNLLNRTQQLFQDLETDGNIGGQSLTALRALTPKDMPVLRELIRLYQGKRYIEITEHDTSQEKFIRGWIGRLL